MPPTESTSLIDDHQFAAELDKLELSAPDPQLASTLERWDRLEDGLVTGRPGDVEAEEWSAKRPVFDDAADEADTNDDLPPPERLSLGRAALIAGGLLLMMGLGAGAAVAVFHDRVAQILHR